MQEQMRVLLLDTRHCVRGQRVIYQGTVNSIVDVRIGEVLRPAVAEGWPAIVVVHNHPSGDPQPSRDDVALTRRMKEGADLLGIKLLDHVIVGGRERHGPGYRFYSLREQGDMESLV